MQKDIDFGITVRGLIVDRGELLMVQHGAELDYYALPGGHLEPGERLKDAMARELLEETGVTARVGNAIIVNDWLNTEHQRVEFFFWILNPADFRGYNTKTASHGYELSNILFADPKDYHLLPHYLVEKFPRIRELGNDYPMELIQSV
jgi:ADP-ribose pyrophosphatase YjhB (NUDIX family)